MHNQAELYNTTTFESSNEAILSSVTASTIERDDDDGDDRAKEEGGPWPMSDETSNPHCGTILENEGRTSIPQVEPTVEALIRIEKTLSRLTSSISSLAISASSEKQACDEEQSQDQGQGQGQVQDQTQDQEQDQREDPYRWLNVILEKIEQVKQALIAVEAQPFDKHTKPAIDFDANADASPNVERERMQAEVRAKPQAQGTDPELLMAWCRSHNRYDYTRALCELMAKLKAEEVEERRFLRGVSKIQKRGGAV
ncbi:hypothetical protein BC939DRAFT_527186 [Gamsiella multidivaricata]|uniref:uncharacterized protein n=1 Tax=Gamsiella multidivaricata TaxID=101098 RepID=UPI00221EB775|nr:uncharacterized protein BC939DRAFT_527186 [Gamsiella multidivaricata]KAI7827422.1 hypothetical protein BC939DRAFT_527186 [Gamsiella multidivaricata]